MTFFLRFLREVLRLGDPATMGRVASGSAGVGDAGIGETRGAEGVALDLGVEAMGVAEGEAGAGGFAASSRAGDASGDAPIAGEGVLGIGRLEIWS